MSFTSVLEDRLVRAMNDEAARFITTDRCEKGDAGQTRAIVSSRRPDRVGDVIEPRGMDFSNYMRPEHGVLLFQHNYAEAPVGKCVKIWATDDDIRAEFVFADTTRGEELRKLYRGGFMSSFSVGFKPTARPLDLPNGGKRFTRAELLEISCVSVPANADAHQYGISLSSIVMKGMIENRSNSGVGVGAGYDHDESLKAIRLLAAAGDASVESMFGGRTRILRYHDLNGCERTVIQHS